MGLAVLLELGIEALAEERSALEEEVGIATAASALAALRDLPAVLQGLDELAWREDVQPRDRAAFTVVVSYGMKTLNRIPAVGSRRLLGIIDDAYLAFHAAASVRSELPGVPVDRIRDGEAALAATLSTEVREALSNDLRAALDAIDALSMGPH